MSSLEEREGRQGGKELDAIAEGGRAEEGRRWPRNDKDAPSTLRRKKETLVVKREKKIRAGEVEQRSRKGKKETLRTTANTKRKTIRAWEARGRPFIPKKRGEKM